MGRVRPEPYRKSAGQCSFSDQDAADLYIYSDFSIYTEEIFVNLGSIHLK